MLANVVQLFNLGRTSIMLVRYGFGPIKQRSYLLAHLSTPVLLNRAVNGIKYHDVDGPHLNPRILVRVHFESGLLPRNLIDHLRVSKKNEVLETKKYTSSPFEDNLPAEL